LGTSTHSVPGHIVSDGVVTCRLVSIRPNRIGEKRTRLVVRPRPTHPDSEYCEKRSRPRDRGLSSTHLVCSSAKAAPVRATYCTHPESAQRLVEDVPGAFRRSGQPSPMSTIAITESMQTPHSRSGVKTEREAVRAMSQKGSRLPDHQPHESGDPGPQYLQREPPLRPQPEALSRQMPPALHCPQGRFGVAAWV